MAAPSSPEERLPSGATLGRIAWHGVWPGEVVLDELERVLVETIRLPRADVAEILAFLREHPV